MQPATSNQQPANKHNCIISFFLSFSSLKVKFWHLAKNPAHGGGKRFGWKYLILFLLTLSIFILPSLFFSLLYDFYQPTFQLVFVVSFLLVSLILPLVRPTSIAVFILVFFAIMEIISFSHLFYFQTHLNVYSLHLMFDEVGEIWQTAKSFLPNGLWHILFIILIYAVCIFAYIKINFKKSFIGLFFIVILLSYLPYKATFKTPKISNFLPISNSFMPYNDLRIFSAYFFIYLKQDKVTIPQFAQRTIKFNPKNEDKNVILILGESVNAAHIGLLGYERNTTPKLKEIFEKNENFVIKQGFSSSILTKNSLPLFFNIAYHPQNIQQNLSQNTHLLKLAKKAGYKIFYISNQTQAEAAAIGGNEYIDVLLTKEDYPVKSENIGDLLLIEQFEIFKKEFEKGKNLVILHQRNPHSPYENGYRAYNEANVFPLQGVSEKQARINAYDNALIFNDYIISEIFNSADSLSNPSYVLFIPDHGEAMFEKNEKGEHEFGHAFLSVNVAKIPIIAGGYKVNSDDIFLSNLKNISYPTHYEVGNLLAQLLGYEINEPNLKENIFYIQGVDIAGNAGFIEITKKDNISFKEIQN